MSDGEQTASKHEHKEKEACMHQWFWQDFSLQPPEHQNRREHSDCTAATHSFWDGFTHAVQDLSRVAGASAISLHQWFWKDFVLSPRTQGAHQHSSHRDGVQWCWEQCLVAPQEPMQDRID